MATLGDPRGREAWCQAVGPSFMPELRTPPHCITAAGILGRKERQGWVRSQIFNLFMRAEQGVRDEKRRCLPSQADALVLA